MNEQPARSRIVAIMTARDSQETIADAVTACLATPAIDSCIVIDDGSRDETASRAEAAGARIVRLWNHVGAGKALDTALTRAEDATVIVVVEPRADRLAETITSLVAAVSVSGCGLAFATAKREGSTALLDRIVHSSLVRAGVRIDRNECLTGDWAMTQEAATDCRPLSTGYAAETLCIGRSVFADRGACAVDSRRAASSANRGLQRFVRIVHSLLAAMRLAAVRAQRAPGR